MKRRIKVFARRVSNVLSPRSTRELHERVDRLERELDEYRRDSLRVAEMLDLVETQLTPGNSTQRADTPASPTVKNK